MKVQLAETITCESPAWDNTGSLFVRGFAAQASDSQCAFSRRIDAPSINITTETFARESRSSGTEYASSIERTRRRDWSGFWIISAVAAVCIVGPWVWKLVTL